MGQWEQKGGQAQERVQLQAKGDSSLTVYLFMLSLMCTSTLHSFQVIALMHASFCSCSIGHAAKLKAPVPPAARHDVQGISLTWPGGVQDSPFDQPGGPGDPQMAFSFDSCPCAA